MTRLIKSRIAGDEAGAALVIVALAMTTLLGMAAFAIDLGNARQATRQAQAGVDGGSLAAAQDLPLLVADAGTAEDARDLAAEYAATSMFQDTVPAITEGSLSADGRTRPYTVGDVTLTITTPYTASGSLVPNYSLIHVKACRPTNTFFASMLGATSPTVCREGVARRRNASGGLDIGLLALHSSACDSITFGGSSATNLIPSGAVVANSACPNTALSDFGSAWELDADFIGVVGGADLGCSIGDCTAVSPSEGVDSVPDPLAGLPVPAMPATASCSNVGGVFVCPPGRYTSGLSFGSNNTYILRPGLYYLQGDFSSGGGSSVICLNSGVDPNAPGAVCDGVTFYIASGSVDLNGNGEVRLPPPNSATCATHGTCDYNGVTLFQSRTNSEEVQINGTSDFNFGTVYAPAANVHLNGTGGSEEIGIDGMVIGQTIEISGSFSLNIGVNPPDSYVAPEDDYGLER